MTSDLSTLPAPAPGLNITLMSDRMPFAIAKAIGWEGEEEHGRLRLDNGLIVQIRPLDDSQILVGGWYVERSRAGPGYVMARPSLDGDEVLVQAVSGRRADTNPFAPIKAGSSGMRLADWSGSYLPCPSTILSMLPILGDLLIGADDPDELSVGATTLHAYMNRRFGPPNVSYDPSDMPYGAWLFETPLDDMMVWVAPYEILPLQIRAFVTDETNLVLRKAWDDCLVSFYRDRDPAGAKAFAEVVSPYRLVLRDVALDLMRPVAFREDAIDPFGPMNEWRPARASHASRTPQVLKPHPMSTLALPPSITAQPDLFVDLCRLISESNDGAKATLERLVAQIQSRS